jgi:hypothetical protein
MQKPISGNDRNECLKNAESCLEQAGHDVSRRTYWIAQAAEWLRRARIGSEDDSGASTYEVSDGQLIPKPSAK